MNDDGVRMTVLRHHERLETRTMVYAGRTFEATAQEAAIYRARLPHLATPVEDTEPASDAAEQTAPAADAPAEVEPDAPKRRRRRKRASE